MTDAFLVLPLCLLGVSLLAFAVITRGEPQGWRHLIGAAVCLGLAVAASVLG